MEAIDLVSYEIAKKLKACGFNELCQHYYDTEDAPAGHYWRKVISISRNYNEDILKFSAPTLYAAQKWLREKKQINVLIGDCACGYYWEVSKAGDEQTRGTMLIYYDDNGEDENSGMWLSYEKALEAGISAALDLLAGKEEG